MYEEDLNKKYPNEEDLDNYLKSLSDKYFKKVISVTVVSCSSIEETVIEE